MGKGSKIKRSCMHAASIYAPEQGQTELSARLIVTPRADKAAVSWGSGPREAGELALTGRRAGWYLSILTPKLEIMSCQESHRCGPYPNTRNANQLITTPTLLAGRPHGNLLPDSARA